MACMAVREDCRHYSTRTTGGGEMVQRCRLNANQVTPFACPEDCLFVEPRPITDAGWRRFDTDEATDTGPDRDPKED
jgi:hypothetical protein